MGTSQSVCLEQACLARKEVMPHLPGVRGLNG